MTDAVAPIEKSVLSLPDEHYFRLRHELETVHHPITITNPQGRTVRFRISKGRMVGYEETPTGRVKHEVMRESTIRQKFGAPQELSEKDKLKLVLKRDKPELTDEQIDYKADIIIEGRKTMVSLIQSGVPVDAAKNLVQYALRMKSEDVIEALKEAATKRGETLPDISGAEAT